MNSYRPSSCVDLLTISTDVLYGLDPVLSKQMANISDIKKRKKLINNQQWIGGSRIIENG